MVLSTMASPTGSVVTRLSQRRRGRKRRNTKEPASKTLPVFSCTVGNALFLHLVYVYVDLPLYKNPRSRLCGGGGGEQGPSFPVVWRRGRRAGTPVPGCVEEGEEGRDPRSRLCGGGGGEQGPGTHCLHSASSSCWCGTPQCSCTCLHHPVPCCCGSVNCYYLIMVGT